jgi:hypothetical protein
MNEKDLQATIFKLSSILESQQIHIELLKAKLEKALNPEEEQGE